MRNDPPVNLVKVDCTEAGKDTCGRFEVRGYPTLKIFKNGELSSDYNGPREAAGITKYMRSQVGPASKEVKTVAEAEAVLAKPEVVIFGFGAADSTIMKTFAKTADKLRESYMFAHSSEEAVLAKLGQKEGVVLYRPNHLANKFEESTVSYTGSGDDKGALASFIADNKHGICGHRTSDNGKEFKVRAERECCDIFYCVTFFSSLGATCGCLLRRGLHQECEGNKLLEEQSPQGCQGVLQLQLRRKRQERLPA